MILNNNYLRLIMHTSSLGYEYLAVISIVVGRTPEFTLLLAILLIRSVSELWYDVCAWCSIITHNSSCVSSLHGACHYRRPISDNHIL